MERGQRRSRVPTEIGKPEKWKWSWKSQICQKSWNFVISHGNLPILHPNLYFFVTAKKLSSNLRKSAFSDVFRKMSWMQNREEKWSWKIKKWSWKSHDKIFCQVCGNPEGGKCNFLLFDDQGVASLLYCLNARVYVNKATTSLHSWCRCSRAGHWARCLTLTSTDSTPDRPWAPGTGRKMRRRRRRKVGFRWESYLICLEMQWQNDKNAHNFT